MRYLGYVRRAALTGRTSLAIGLLLATALAVLTAPSPAAATVGTNDYPSNLRSAAQDSRVDPWNFYNRECTSFVAWRLNNDVGLNFHNWYLGKHWGDAAIWKRAAVDSGVPVDNVPSKGSIAWWAKGSPGSSSGHVAWVMSASSTSITIEEYNYATRGGYGQRTIAKTSSKWPSAFIHLGKPTLSNTARPTVAGQAQVNVPLTASPGTWTPSGATFAYQWYADDVAVSGATKRTFTPAGARLGQRIRVKVTASLAEATSSSTTSAATAAVAPGVLTPTAAPVVSGTPQVGVQISTTASAWSPSASRSYQWLSGGKPIPGATQSVFTPTADQVGAPLTVKVTGTRAGYTPDTSTSSASKPVQPGAFATVTPPTVTGTAQVDQPLTATAGAWSPSADPAYQWLVDGQPVAGATGSSFTPAAADLRKQVAVQVTASRVGYSTATATSAATAGVVPATFQNTGDPSIQGTPRVGMPLRALPGGWSPEPTLGYQWSAGGTPIAGATASTFTPTAAQAGKTLTVRVTASRPGYLTSVVDTRVTAAVLPGTNSVRTVPEISGRPLVGQTLTATGGTWAVPPTSVTYAWFADGKAVPGAVSSKLALTRAQLDQRITVAVTGTADGYAPLVATSAATAATVLGDAAFTGTPTISGIRRVGHQLTAHTGTVTPSTATATYQWLRSGHPIAGATERTYLLRSADVGRRLSVRIALAAPHRTPAIAGAGTGKRVRTVPRLTARTSAHDTWAGVSMRVRAPGLADPRGTVRVYDGRTQRATAAIRDGRAYVRLDRLSRGTHHLVLRYLGRGAQAPATLRISVRIG